MVSQLYTKFSLFLITKQQAAIQLAHLQSVLLMAQTRQMRAGATKAPAEWWFAFTRRADTRMPDSSLCSFCSRSEYNHSLTTRASSSRVQPRTVRLSGEPWSW